MGAVTEELIDWRFEVAKREFTGKKIEIASTEGILHALFFLDDVMPFANPQASVEHVANAYWNFLERASHIFTAAEWQILSGPHSPFSRGELARKNAGEAVAEIKGDYPGDEWCDGLLAVRKLLPKVASLSDVEFLAVNEILSLVGNLASDDPWFTISRKLPALATD